MLQDLKSELKDMHYSYLDTYSIFTNFIDNPTTYGTCNILRIYKSARTKRLYVHLFSHISGLWLSNLRIVFLIGFNETKAACCGLGKLKARVPCTPVSEYCSNRSNHVFWDIYHPTQTTAHTFIDILFSDSREYVTPVTIQQLIAIWNAYTNMYTTHDINSSICSKCNSIYIFSICILVFLDFVILKNEKEVKIDHVHCNVIFNLILMSKVNDCYQTMRRKWPNNMKREWYNVYQYWWKCMLLQISNTEAIKINDQWRDDLWLGLVYYFS